MKVAVDHLADVVLGRNFAGKLLVAAKARTGPDSPQTQSFYEASTSSVKHVADAMVLEAQIHYGFGSVERVAAARIMIREKAVGRKRLPTVERPVVVPQDD